MCTYLIVRRTRAMESVDMNFELRPAKDEDFEFAWSLYRELTKPLAEELLEWNDVRQAAVVKEALRLNGTSIIVVNGANAGWLQVRERPTEIYLGQLYITAEMQNHGIGTSLIRDICDRAQIEKKPLTLDVMKNSRARRFYEKLEFCVTGESEYKLEMRWQQGAT